MNPVMWGSTGGGETLFGGSTSQIPNVSPCMGATTIQAALTDAEHIPPNPPDCATLTVTLQCILLLQRRSRHSTAFCAPEAWYA